MQTATIVKDRTGNCYHIRISPEAPQTGGDVDVVDILLQKDGEGDDAFKARCTNYVRERCP